MTQEGVPRMAASQANSPTSPGNGQPLRRRRFIFTTLVLLTSAALLALMAATLMASGPDALGLAMLALYALTLPWTTIGFWHAALGLALMAFTRDPAGRVAPHLRSIRGDEPITSRTALLVCIRHEDTQRLQRNLTWMLDGLVATGQAPWFHLYLLSDSTEPDTAAAEQQVAAALKDRFGQHIAITYRRREAPSGFKAGNLRDFCERWGALHEYAIVLDADSVMTPAAMLRLVRIMQVQPRIGILQTLVTGLPSASPFARVFQFGMRLGMRSYTLGAAWWQGDCGPYWGHNAILRLAPFTAHCHLPVLPGPPPLGGHVLSHDQLEAVLMRRAGFEVRVLPEEEGSWEENPPTLPEFTRRDLRWCQGNMQYFQFLRLPGLRAVSRAQLGLAIAMYLGAPAWLGFMTLGLLRHQPLRLDLGALLFAASLVMTFAPKLATLADVLFNPRLRRLYGGTARVLVSALLETVFSMLIGPTSAVAVTLFLLGLPGRSLMGKEMGWAAQHRDVHGVPFTEAARRFWPQTLLGLLFGAWFWQVMPGAVWFWAPFVVGLVGAIPIAMITALPALGRLLVATGLCRIPEEARWPDEPAYAELFAPAHAVSHLRPDHRIDHRPDHRPSTEPAHAAD